MKNILILTDFSDRAENAADYATNLAIALKANLILCHALEIKEQLSYPLADHLILQNQMMTRLKETGARLHDLISKICGDTTLRPTISLINDLDVLTDVADKIVEERFVDMVVIGAHKSNGLGRFLLGSHTNEILDHIKCPVLIVPENVVFSKITNITYATDLTFDTTKVIDYLVRVAQPFKAEISVNHISSSDAPLTPAEKKAEYSILCQMNKSNVRLSYKTIKGDSVTRGLLEINDPQKTNIMTLVHKRYDFFEGLFHSSISKQIAHNTKVPLLVMPFIFSLSNEDMASAIN